MTRHSTHYRSPLICVLSCPLSASGFSLFLLALAISPRGLAGPRYLPRRPRGPSLSPRRPRGTSLSRPEASLTLAISPGGLLAGPRANSAEASRALAQRPRGPSLSPRRPRGPSLSPWWPRGPGVSGLHIWFFRLCGAVQKPKLWKCLVFTLASHGSKT